MQYRVVNLTHLITSEDEDEPRAEVLERNLQNISDEEGFELAFMVPQQSNIGGTSWPAMAVFTKTETWGGMMDRQGKDIMGRQKP